MHSKLDSHRLDSGAGETMIRSGFRLLLLGAALLAGGSPARADGPSREDLANFFRPERTTQIALAPDGRHLAYTVREEKRLQLVIVDIDAPEQKTTAFIESDSPKWFWSRAEAPPANVSFLGWASNDILVYALNLPPSKTRPRQEVRAVDADGKNARTLLDSSVAAAYPQPPPGLGGRAIPPSPFPRRLRVVGLTADTDGIIVEAGPTQTELATTVYRVDTRTGKRQTLYDDLINGRLQYDQQGCPRLLQTPRIQSHGPPPGARKASTILEIRAPNGLPFWRSTIAVVPQRILYRAAGGSAWEDLDRMLAPAATLNFHYSDEDYYQPRSIPLTFDADPALLYFASNIGRDTYGIYALDLHTRQRTNLAVENAAFDLVDPEDLFSDAPLVFDRQRRLAGVRLGPPAAGTRWLDPELARLQRELDGKFPGRWVKILAWSDQRTRLLVQVSAAGDPGRYFVVEPSAHGRLMEFLRRAPWLASESLAQTAPFEFDRPAGAHLTGTVTLPTRTRINPPPLVLLCRDLPGRRAGLQGARFNCEAQALAAMGFMVAQVNYRGLSGFGAQHRDAVRSGFDRVPLDDLRAAIDWIRAHYRCDRRRVALVGEGFGGYLALRALELSPSEFRCAVSIDAPTDLEDWVWESDVLPPVGRLPAGFSLPPSATIGLRRAFFGAAGRPGAETSVLGHADALTQPVFIVQDPNRTDLGLWHGRRLRDRLRRDGRDPEYLEFTGGFARDDPVAAAKLFSRIGDFLDANVYDYSVRIGKLKVLE